MKNRILLTLLLLCSLGCLPVGSASAQCYIIAGANDWAICHNSTDAFYVAVSDTSTYTWQVDTGAGWIDVAVFGAAYGVTSGATPANAGWSRLEVRHVGLEYNGYRYRCVVHSPCGTLYSGIGTLTVLALPSDVLFSLPHDSTACAGSSASFKVSHTPVAGSSGATLGTVTYQWHRRDKFGHDSVISDGGHYSGATTSVLSVSALTVDLDSSYYWCAVDIPCQTMAYGGGRLRVSGAPVITTQPADITRCEMLLTTFTVGASGSGLTYQWQVNDGSGWVNVAASAEYSGETTNMLRLTNALFSLNGYQYRCLVNGSCGTSISDAATLNVQPRTTFTSFPSDVTTCAGTSATFHVTAAGIGPITYRWMRMSAGGWGTPLTETYPYSGVHTATLTIDSVTAALDSAQYFCEATGPCGTMWSNFATLRVHPASVITSNPHDTLVCAGLTIPFSVEVSGTVTGYQWQVNAGTGWVDLVDNADYSSVTTPVMHVWEGTTEDGLRYRCLITTACGVLTSDEATLHVFPIIHITSAPHNDTVCAGNNAVFSVAAAGHGILRYQWYKQQASGSSIITTALADGVGIAGTHTAVLTLSSVTPAMNGTRYYCVVRDTCTGAASFAATLTVVTFTSFPVTLTPMNNIVCENASASFHISYTTTGLIGVTYQWYMKAPYDGYVAVPNTAPFSGQNTATLTISSASLSLDGYKFYCTVSNACGVLSASGEALLTVNSGPEITTQPADVTMCEMLLTTFTVGASGSGLAYQWQVNDGSGWTNVVADAEYSGETTNTLRLTNALLSLNDYQYRCVVSGSCGSAISNAASLNVMPGTTFTSFPSDVTTCAGTSAAFHVTTAGSGPITYRWMRMSAGGWGTPLTETYPYSGVHTATLTIDSVTAALDGAQYFCEANGPCGTVWGNFATLHVTPGAEIISGPHDTLVCPGLTIPFHVSVSGAVTGYQWQVDSGMGWVNLVNSWKYSAVTTATMQVLEGTYDDGLKYRCLLTTSCGPLVSEEAILHVFPTIHITSSPQYDTVCAGGNATFSVSAVGTGLLHYQWYREHISGSSVVTTTLSDGGNFSGATSSTLTVSGVDALMNGDRYYCVVRDTCTASASFAAKLTVTTYTSFLVTITPEDDTVCEGAATSFHISYTATGLVGITYQWYMKAPYGAYDPVPAGAPFSGQNTATLNISSTAGLNGYKFACLLSNPCGVVSASHTSILTLTTFHALAPAEQPKDQKVCAGNTAHFSTVIPGDTGIGLVYQWYVKPPAGAYTLVANGGPFSGVNSSMLTVSPVDMSMNGYKFYSVLAGPCGIVSSTQEALLSVNPCDTPVYHHPSEWDIHVYPNPATGNSVNIKCEELRLMTARVKVADRLGHILITTEVKFSDEGVSSLDISKLQTGFYIVNLINEAGDKVKSTTLTK